MLLKIDTYKEERVVDLVDLPVVTFWPETKLRPTIFRVEKN